MHADIRDGDVFSSVLGGRAQDAQGRSLPPADAVWHLAAETHVDRSILGPSVFVDTNVTGTQRILEALRAAQDAGRPRRFVHVSTDEVYGSLAAGDAAFTEVHPLLPSSPYAASKAASDLLVQAWARTYGLDAVITRCSNNYGPFQFPELIPLMIVRAMADQPLPVYGDGQQVRDWLHVDDHASALWAVSSSGIGEGRVFNIGAQGERPNLEVVQAVLAALGKPASLINTCATGPRTTDATRWTPAPCARRRAGARAWPSRTDWRRRCAGIAIASRGGAACWMSRSARRRRCTCRRREGPAPRRQRAGRQRATPRGAGCGAGGGAVARGARRD